MAMTFTTANDIILSSVRKEETGAAASISETGYELGMALGIATLGSIVMGIYRGFQMPDGISPDSAAQAQESLAGAGQAARSLPGDQGPELLLAAQEAFTTGLATASTVGTVLMLTAAALSWYLLRRPVPAVADTETVS